ncbi:translational activator for mitochondrial COX1 [Cryptotrichosporon argae]
MRSQVRRIPRAPRALVPITRPALVPRPLVLPAAERTIFSFLRRKARSSSSTFSAGCEPAAASPTLSQSDLFHPLSESPFEPLRQKAARIKTYALCPVSLRHGQRKAAAYECPDCGFPTHAGRAEWEEGRDEHAEVCGRLREVNEDEHDLRSGRRVTEYERMPGPQAYESAVSLASWDSFFFTRAFPSINSPRAIRHVSKLLTYPISILGVLHQHGPFTYSNGRITNEGRRSMAALHSTLHLPPGSSLESTPTTRPQAPVRIFLLGARAESTLPAELWLQLTHLFPRTQFTIYFIGPEVGVPLVDGPRQRLARFGAETESALGAPTCELSVTPQLKLVSVKARYEDVHTQLGPFDPYQDVFFAFSPGLGFPSQPGIENKDLEGETVEPALNATEADEAQQAGPLVQAQTTWRRPLQQILTTKCGLFFTAFSPTDLSRDVSALLGTPPPTQARPGDGDVDAAALSEYPASIAMPTAPVPAIKGVTDEFELVLAPGENPFGSRKWEVAEWDTRVGVKTNWGIWGIRGKRYEVVREEEVEE